MSDERIATTREEALAIPARELAASLSFAEAWNIAGAQAAAMPSTPTIITRKDSSTETLRWQRGLAPWQSRCT
jgi:hypothetical protein